MPDEFGDAGRKRDSTLAWQRYDAQGKPLGERGSAQGVAVWNFAVAIAEKDGNFTVSY